MPNTHKYILAIDQGTTGTTALLVDQKLNIVSKANFEFDQIFPKPGWVEHKDTDIWESVRKSVTKCLELSELTQSQALSQIAAIGITNQRETTCLFDKAGRALHNFVVWQCKRSTEICEELKSHNLEQKFRDKTGLLLDPYFSGTKLKWLLNNNKFEQNLKNNNLLFGNIDSWLVYKL